MRTLVSYILRPLSGLFTGLVAGFITATLVHSAPVAESDDEYQAAKRFAEYFKKHH